MKSTLKNIAQVPFIVITVILTLVCLVCICCVLFTIPISMGVAAQTMTAEAGPYNSTVKPSETPEAFLWSTEPPKSTSLPDFAPLFTFSGTGEQSTDVFIINPSILRIKLTHDGAGYFSVDMRPTDDSLVNTEYLVNVVGPYEGQKIITANSGEYFFDIEADGKWTITVEYK